MEEMVNQNIHRLGIKLCKGEVKELSYNHGRKSELKHPLSGNKMMYR